MYKVRIAGLREFEQSRERWNNLVLSMDIPSIFCTWEWIHTWWEFFGKDCEPFFLFIYGGEQLKGIFPLAMYRKTFGNKSCSNRLLAYCGSLELYPDHLDMISYPDEADPCIKAVFDFLINEHRDWDLLTISLLSEGGKLISYLRKKKAVLNYQIKESSVAPFIPLSGTFNDYMNTFDHKQRYNRKRGQKQLSEKFKFRYISGNLSESTDGLKTLFHLHGLRAESKDRLSTFIGQRLFDFHDSLAEKIRSNDWLWLRFLGNEEKIISAFYGFALGGHLFYYQLGLDPEWERYSPGKALLLEVIKEAFSKEYTELDFLRGDEAYKNLWAKGRRKLYSLNIFNKTVRGEYAKITHNIKGLARAILRS